MLPSITSVFSARAFSIPLVMCLLGITVIARPIDQVGPGSTALQTSVARNYNPEIFLTRYIDKRDSNLQFADNVLFRIGKTKICRPLMQQSSQNLKKQPEVKLGQLHFSNEEAGKQALVEAQAHASYWQSDLNLNRMANWKYLLDVLAFLYAKYDAVDDQTFERWGEYRPRRLLLDVDLESNSIALILHRDRPTVTAENGRPTSKVSLRIGDKWFISPERKAEDISILDDPLFFALGSIKESYIHSHLNFDALRESAVKHTKFLDDESEWLSVLEEKYKAIEEQSGKAWGDYFGEWLYTDGIVGYLLEKNAVNFSRSNWIKTRNRNIDIYVNILCDFYGIDKKKKRKGPS
ncbi:hypothetical protein EV361DRAFT_956089 [Lentinula raphanica]|nr:hypothetical protein F5880DRAFT_1618284 [Lentinula raphanica]KAJ3964294.1 hypothetical protein EV361DRAFT_956089 [Lentinula raphanica]